VVQACVFSSSNQAVNTPTLTEPADWTVVRENAVVQNSRTQGYGIYYKVAGSEGASYDFSSTLASAASQSIVVVMNTFRGVQTTNVLDIPYVAGTHEVVADVDVLTSPNMDAPNITTVTADAFVVTCLGVNLDNILTLSAPAGFTLAGSTVPSNARNLGAAYIDAGAAGAEVIGEWGLTEVPPGTATTTRGFLATIALRPAPTSGMHTFRRRRG
jgi:hypothetical protein